MLFRKYKTTPKEIRAVQYFPYLKLDIEGFSSVSRALAPNNQLDLMAAQETVITHGQFQTSERDAEGNPIFIPVYPGDWVIKEDGSIKVMRNSDFNYYFSEVDE